MDPAVRRLQFLNEQQQTALVLALAMVQTQQQQIAELQEAVTRLNERTEKMRSRAAESATAKDVQGYCFGTIGK